MAVIDVGGVGSVGFGEGKVAVVDVGGVVSVGMEKPAAVGWICGTSSLTLSI